MTQGTQARKLVLLDATKAAIKAICPISRLEDLDNRGSARDQDA
jgi:hypothetical protein